MISFPSIFNDFLLRVKIMEHRVCGVEAGGDGETAVMKC